jgi:predicted XRE-type DNA-binding protein
MTQKLFEDLGFSSAEARTFNMKTELLTKIVKAASHYSQHELANILQTSQPRISDLMRGKMSKFSLDMLVNYAGRLGLHTSIKIQARTKGASAGVSTFAD